MKIKKFFAAATAALGLATLAQAQTEIFIAGAPALRTELTTAIENLLLGQASVDRTFNGSAIITANVVRWRNATIGGQNNVTIHLVYNGSAGGWKTNSASQNVRYFPDSETAGSGKTDVLSNTTAAAKLAVPDFHISNEYQDSTPWIGTNTISFPENGATTYQALVDEIVGILPLRLVASKGAPEGLNIPRSSPASSTRTANSFSRSSPATSRTATRRSIRWRAVSTRASAPSGPPATASEPPRRF